MGTEMILVVAVVLAGAGIFALGIAAMVHTAYRFLAIAVTLDAQFAREFGAQRAILDAYMKQMKATPETSEGYFEGPTDEDLKRKEEERILRDMGIPEEEAKEFMEQGYGG